jgi:spectinomycin phosphotransferase
MLEKPNLPDETIIACLHDSYGLAVTGLEFLPIGNDATAWVYRVGVARGNSYFLKVKRGLVYAPSLLVPRYLKDQGIEPVVAPLQTQTHALWQSLAGFSLILYPFIEGRVGMEAGLSERLWREFGTVLKGIHATRLPASLAGQIK